MAHNLDDDEILSMVEGEINGSSDYMDSEISSQREKAMEYFYGEPFGNEEEGRSQVVVTDVQDTLMWKSDPGQILLWISFQPMKLTSILSDSSR